MVVGDWNPYPEIATRQKLLARAAEMYPPIISNGLPPNPRGFKVISDIVGRRPTSLK